MVRPVNAEYSNTTVQAQKGEPIRSARNTQQSSITSASKNEGCCQSISQFISNVWEWIKTHICCYFCSRTDPCPIPEVTEGDQPVVELHKDLREFWNHRFENHPEIYQTFAREFVECYYDIYVMRKPIPNLDNLPQKEKQIFKTRARERVQRLKNFLDQYSSQLQKSTPDVDYIEAQMKKITNHLKNIFPG